MIERCIGCARPEGVEGPRVTTQHRQLPAITDATFASVWATRPPAEVAALDAGTHRLSPGMRYSLPKGAVTRLVGGAMVQVEFACIPGMCVVLPGGPGFLAHVRRMQVIDRFDESVTAEVEEVT